MLDLQHTVDALNLFGDPTRVRLAALLSEEELTVAELTRITDLPQSRVSTHLGKLREAGLLLDRRSGTSTHYTLNPAGMHENVRRLWSLVHAGLDDALVESDRRRRDAVLRARESAEGWPDAIAGRMERHYSPGRTWEATTRGLLGLIQLGDVLDIGSGDGVIAQLLAPRARSITCVDRSPKLIEAARKRLVDRRHVRFAIADMNDLPFDDETFDQVLLFNVLTYAEDPTRVLAEAARVMRAGGTASLVTLRAHQHVEISSAYSHLNHGFAPDALGELLERSGLEVDVCGVTSRERRKPYFEVVSAFARKPGAAPVRAAAGQP